jgi:hypothetical protein
MKLNRRQLRRLILQEMRIVTEANTAAAAAQGVVKKIQRFLDVKDDSIWGAQTEKAYNEKIERASGLNLSKDTPAEAIDRMRLYHAGRVVYGEMNPDDEARDQLARSLADLKRLRNK